MQSNDPRNKYKAEIPKDSGGLGIEFTLDRTITEFIRGTERVNLDYVQSFAEFGNVLQGRLLSDWKQVLDDYFPEPVDPESVSSEHDRSTADSFKRAIELFLKHTLNEPKPRDRQWIYMMPGGDFGVRKDLLVSPLDHLHRFKEMLRIAQMLPEGDIQHHPYIPPAPSDEQRVDEAMEEQRVERSVTRITNAPQLSMHQIPLPHDN